MSSNRIATLITALIALLSGGATAVLPAVLEPYRELALPVFIGALLWLAALLILQYRHPPLPEPPPPHPALRQRYLERRVAEWNTLRLQAVATEAADAQTQPLALERHWSRRQQEIGQGDHQYRRPLRGPAGDYGSVTAHDPQFGTV